MYLSDRECASCVQDKGGWVLVCITNTTEDVRKQQQQQTQVNAMFLSIFNCGDGTASVPVTIVVIGA